MQYFLYDLLIKIYFAFKEAWTLNKYGCQRYLLTYSWPHLCNSKTKSCMILEDKSADDQCGYMMYQEMWRTGQCLSWDQLLHGIDRYKGTTAYIIIRLCFITWLVIQYGCQRLWFALTVLCNQNREHRNLKKEGTQSYFVINLLTM